MAEATLDVNATVPPEDTPAAEEAVTFGDEDGEEPDAAPPEGGDDGSNSDDDDDDDDPFPPHSYVAVKVGDYPFWPAKVVNPADVGVAEETVGENQRCVFFFGTHDVSICDTNPETFIAFDPQAPEWTTEVDVTVADAVAELHTTMAAEAAAGAANEGDDAVAGDDDEAARRHKKKKDKKSKKEKKHKKDKKKDRHKDKHKDKHKKDKHKVRHGEEGDPASEKRLKERKPTGLKSEKKLSRHHRDADDVEDEFVRDDDKHEAPALTLKRPAPTQQLKEISVAILDALDNFDVDTVRDKMSELTTIEISLQQLLDSKLGHTMAAVYNSSLYAAKPLALVLMRYWAHALPTNERILLKTVPIEAPRNETASYAR